MATKIKMDHLETDLSIKGGHLRCSLPQGTVRASRTTALSLEAEFDEVAPG